MCAIKLLFPRFCTKSRCIENRIYYGDVAKYLLEEKGNIFKLEGSVRRRNLSSSHGTDFTLWITEDLRIPLLFKVTTEAGSLTARALVGETNE